MNIKELLFVIVFGLFETIAAQISQNNTIKKCSSLSSIPPHLIIHSFHKHHRVFGSTLYFSCTKNYRLVGPNNIQCTKNGWSPKFLPYCKVLKCRDPGSPIFGRRFGNNFTIGATVLFFCQTGFELFGSNNITCQENRKWSGDLTTCQDNSTYCPDPGIPVSSTKFGKGYNYGNIVKYSCNYGYTLKGSKIRKCLKNGLWSGVTPVCEDNNIPPAEIASELLKQNFVDKLMVTTCSSRTSNCSNIDTRARRLLQSYRNGLDLIFVMDSSSSIKEHYFKLGLELIKEMVRIFGIGKNNGGTQIACVSFATIARYEFGFGDYSVSKVVKAIKKISKIKFQGGGTNIEEALKMVNKQVLPMARSDSKKALLFITDGKSNMGDRPAAVARRIKKKNVDIYVIGIGYQVKYQELMSLVSSPNNLFRIRHYVDIEKLIDRITDYSQCGMVPRLKSRLRVVGGAYSRPGKWPWAALMEGPLGRCGATLLDKRWVLTAAHCIVPNAAIQLFSPDYDPSNYLVKLGYTSLKKKKQRQIDVLIEDLFVHQDYMGEPSVENDIALLKLKPHPSFQNYTKYIQRICLPKKMYFTERKLRQLNGGIAVGWGSTLQRNFSDSVMHSPTPLKPAQSLKEVFLPFVNDSLCKNRTVVNGRDEREWLFDNNTMLCAGGGKGVNDTCVGDSGGPLMVKVYDKDFGVHRWVQLGITSWGIGCASKNEYAYMTKVPAYLDWIEKTIKENTL